MTRPSVKCKLSSLETISKSYSYERVESDLKLPPPPPSYLKTLIPAFNECVDKMVEKLTPLADGVTLVLMKKAFSTVTLDVISKVKDGIEHLDSNVIIERQ